MMQGGSKKGVRKQWATKVRTGCISCKKRRVKCDEQKPTCRRCYIRDIKCEGYEDLSYRPPKLSFESNATWQVDENLSPDPGRQKDLSPYATSLCNGQILLENCSSKSHTATDGARSSRDSLSIQKYTGYSVPYAKLACCSQNHDRSIRVGNMTTQISQSVPRSLWAYSNPVEQKSLQDYLQIMLPMGRSDVGFHYWTVTVPTLSYSFGPVRYAQTAMSIVMDSLRRGDDEEAFRNRDIVAVKWANKAIRGLVEDNSRDLPPEVPIVVSTLFWLLELCAGRLVSSLEHLTAGHNMAASLAANIAKSNDPMIPQYVKAFISMLPPPVHPEVIRLSTEERERNFQFMARHAKAIMEDAVERLEFTKLHIESLATKHKAVGLYIMNKQLRETGVVIQNWPPDKASLTEDGLLEPEDLQKAVEKHSPFVTIFENLKSFFVDDDESHLLKFDIDFKPAVDHFMWLAAHDDIELRRLVMKLWSIPRSATDMPRRPLD